MRLRALRADDVDWVVDVHARHYGAAHRFDASFAPVVRDALRAFLRDGRPGVDLGAIATVRGAPVGSIVCTCAGPSTARLRLVYLEPALRGRGTGRAMIRFCLAHAARVGFDAVEVATYTEHAEACAAYLALGFVRTDERPATAFGRELTEVRFRRTVRPADEG